MPKTKNPEKMPMITVHLPKQMIEAIDELVARGIFPNRSEAVRAALREMLYKYGEVGKAEPQKEEKKEEGAPIPLLNGR